MQHICSFNTFSPVSHKTWRLCLSLHRPLCHLGSFPLSLSLCSVSVDERAQGPTGADSCGVDADPAGAVLEGRHGFEGSRQERPRGWSLFSTDRKILAQGLGLLLNQCANVGYVSSFEGCDSRNITRGAKLVYAFQGLGLSLCSCCFYRGGNIFFFNFAEILWKWIKSFWGNWIE